MKGTKVTGHSVPKCVNQLGLSLVSTMWSLEKHNLVQDDVNQRFSLAYLVQLIPPPSPLKKIKW